MPAYSQRKRKIAKKSTRRSKKRLSRRIKTRRGGGKMNIDKLQSSFKTFLTTSTDPVYAVPEKTAENFFDLFNENNEITSIIEKHNNLDFETRNQLIRQLIGKLMQDKDAVNNQVFINFLNDAFELSGK